MEANVTVTENVTPNEIPAEVRKLAAIAMSSGNVMIHRRNYAQADLVDAAAEILWADVRLRKLVQAHPSDHSTAVNDLIARAARYCDGLRLTK